jgi:hypothetical protein
MPIRQASTAVAVAWAHVEAWSSHDFDKARKSLVADVRVTATTTQPPRLSQIRRASTTT